MAPPLTSTARLSRSTDGSPQPPDQQNSSMGAAILPALCPGSTSPRASARPAPRAARGGGPSELRGEAGRGGAGRGRGLRGRAAAARSRGGTRRGEGFSAGPRGGWAAWLRGPPDPRRRGGSWRRGSWAPAPGFLAAVHAARAVPGPRGARPGAGAAGGSPEPHVFHSALCLEPAPRRLSPWKQNRGGGGRSRVGLGPGWGRGWRSRAVAVVTGTEAPLRFIRVTACPPVPPQVFPVWPRPLACPLVSSWPRWPFARS